MYLTLHRPEEALETYRELLGYVKVCHIFAPSLARRLTSFTTVGCYQKRLREIHQQHPRLCRRRRQGTFGSTSSRRERSFASPIQHASKAPKVGLETLEAFYSATMDALQDAKNDVSDLDFLHLLTLDTETGLRRLATICEV